MGKIRGKWNVIHYPESMFPDAEGIAVRRQRWSGDWLLKVIVPVCPKGIHPVNWQRKVCNRLVFLIGEELLTPFKDKRIDMRKFNFRGSPVE